MHRVDTEGHSSNLFQDSSLPRTIVDDDILNAFQEELANTVVAVTPLVKGTNTQLRDIVVGVATTLTLSGFVSHITPKSVKRGKVTILHGAVRNTSGGSAPAGTAVTTLPVGSRPAA